MESLSSDGGVRKRILGEGSGEKCSANARVTLRYRLSLSETDPPFDTSDTRKDAVLSFRLGKGKVIRGLEVLVLSMVEGEKASGILSADYAYGTAGLPRFNVPPGAAIYAEVEVVSVELAEKKKSIAEMTPREQFQEASLCKERGNNFFKEAKVEKAVAEYQRCLRYIEQAYYKASSHDTDVVENVGQSAAKKIGTEAVSSENDAERESDAQDSAEENNKGQGGLHGDQLQSKRQENGVNAEDSVIYGAENVAAPEQEFHENLRQESSETGDGDGDYSGNAEEQAADEGFTEAEIQQESDDAPRSKDIAKPGVTESGYNSFATKNIVPANVEQTAISDDDPNESEVRDIHIAALNNLSLCLIKLGDNKKAESFASLSNGMDPENYKPLYYRYDSPSSGNQSVHCYMCF